MTAEADIANGQVVDVRITNIGTDYFNMSNVVTFEGGFPFEETSFTVQAEDQDAWGEVEQVTLYANGVAIASDSIKPYEFQWGAGAQGYYDLYLAATDNQGNVNTSRVLRRDVFLPPVHPSLLSNHLLLQLSQLIICLIMDLYG